MALEKISDKQKEILEFIKSEILNRGYPPSVRDICEGVHLKSTSSVHAHLETLERKGYIRRDPAKNRAIEIIDDKREQYAQGNSARKKNLTPAILELEKRTEQLLKEMAQLDISVRNEEIKKLKH